MVSHASTTRVESLSHGCDTSPYWRCASLSASCNWVCIEIAMERSRQGVTILPLSRLQQSACDEGPHLTSAQLDLDARKPAPAALAVMAHALGARGPASAGGQPRSQPTSVKAGHATVRIVRTVESYVTVHIPEAWALPLRPVRRLCL
jgi:hypothetical protein